MDKFIEESFYALEKDKMTFKPFVPVDSVRHKYLIESYRQTFLEENIVRTLSTYFNQKPADSCKLMYKVLILSL